MYRLSDKKRGGRHHCYWQFLPNLGKVLQRVKVVVEAERQLMLAWTMENLRGVGYHISHVIVLMLTKVICIRIARENIALKI